MNYTIKNEYYTAKISSLGAELISLKSADGYEYIWQNDEKKFWKNHAPVLFPACGRILDSKYTYDGVEYPLGTHGFLNSVEFKAERVEENKLTLSFDANETTLLSYPFDFTAVADFTLEGDKLIFNFKVKNNSERTMPYMFGWHPGFVLPTEDGQDIEDYFADFGSGIDTLNWFKLQHEVFVSPTSESYPLENSRYRLNEKEIYSNDTLIFTGHANRVKLYADGKPYLLDFSWSDNLPYLCIWKSDANDAKFLCLEPWNSVPGDGETPENFNTRKMARLPANSESVYTYTIKITR